MPVPFVAKPDRFSSDAIIPGKLTDERGFITEGHVIEGVRGPVQLFFSAEGIRQFARRYPQLGLVDSSKLDLSERARADAEARVLELEAEVARQKEALDRIAGLRTAGF